MGQNVSGGMSEVRPYDDRERSKREEVEEMFDRISPRYDLLNRAFSLGIDQGWRRKVVRLLGQEPVTDLLDVATGTGDLALLGASKAEHVVGVDISEGMLEKGRIKIAKARLEDRIVMQRADSADLPFPEASFDAVTVAFGVRNFEHLVKGIGEMVRVLRPGGRLFVLEFSKPMHTPMRQLFRFYFHRVMPLIGRVVSKDHRAYTYLPESVEAFPEGAAFEAILAGAGLQELRTTPLSGGIATLYVGRKPVAP